MGVEEIIESFPSPSPAQLFDALSYYFDNKDEVDLIVVYKNQISD